MRLILCTLLVAMACAPHVVEYADSCAVDNYTWSCPTGQHCVVSSVGCCITDDKPVDCGQCRGCEKDMVCISEGLRCIDEFWCRLDARLCPK